MARTVIRFLSSKGIWDGGAAIGFLLDSFEQKISSTIGE